MKKWKKVRSFMLVRLVYETNHKKFFIIDARNRRAFLKSHLPGAIHVDPFSPSFHLKLKGIPMNQPVMVYCRTFRRSEMICSYLYGNGFKNIIQVADGFTGWNQNKLPLENL